MQQIVSAIKIRQIYNAREERLRESWVTRTLSTFIAAGYMTEDNKPALDAAASLSMDDIEHKVLTAGFPKEPEMRKGGFEKLLGAFGGRPRSN